MTVSPAVQLFFSDGGNDAVESTEPIENENLRVRFNDGHVSDWNITYDEDGTVLDAYCFNEVL